MDSTPITSTSYPMSDAVVAWYNATDGSIIVEDFTLRGKILAFVYCNYDNAGGPCQDIGFYNAPYNCTDSIYNVSSSVVGNFIIFF